ncbi:MAG: GDYXXLXY domain-containing protein [Candidatus Hydrogenedentota bacterium]
MNKSIRIGLLCVVGLAQLSAPVSMILGQERVLREGSQYKFKTAPVDPYDAFRGRYVALSYENNFVPIEPTVLVEDGTRVCAILAVDSDGFARFDRIELRKPASGDYVETHALWTDEGKLYLDLPFDRYYMREELAPQAEIAYREHSINFGVHDAYVAVRVRKGSAAVEELFIDGKPIYEYLAEAPEQSEP